MLTAQMIGSSRAFANGLGIEVTTTADTAEKALAVLNAFKTFITKPDTIYNVSTWPVLVERSTTGGYGTSQGMPSSEGIGYLGITAEYFDVLKEAAAWADETFGVIIPLPSGLSTSARETYEKWIGRPNDLIPQIDRIIQKITALIQVEAKANGLLPDGEKKGIPAWAWWLTGLTLVAGATASVLIWRRRKHGS